MYYIIPEFIKNAFLPSSYPLFLQCSKFILAFLSN